MKLLYFYAAETLIRAWILDVDLHFTFISYIVNKVFWVTKAGLFLFFLQIFIIYVRFAFPAFPAL